VGLADIGTAAGIVSTGVYRHFESKAAILAALLQQVMDLLGQTAGEIVGTAADDRVAISELVRHHVRIAIHDRRILQVYHLEARSLPDEGARRLRRAQRHYIEEWVAVLTPLRPGLTDGEARVLVHAAIGAIQSILFHNSGLPEDRLTALLCTAAYACLGLEPPAEVHVRSLGAKEKAVSVDQNVNK
jgi:AcrR family transcriptional regulator